MDAMIVGLLLFAAVGWALAAWNITTRVKPPVKGHLTVCLTRGKQGMWYWTLRDDDGKAVAISPAKGHKERAQALGQVVLLTTRLFDLSYAEVEDHTIKNPDPEVNA